MMRVQIAVKHMDISEQMKDYAEERAAKLEHYFDRITSMQVTLNRDGNLFSAEMICGGARGIQLVAHEKKKDVFAALDLVTDKMERQLTKLKEKIKGHHVKNSPKTTGRAAKSAED
ncbi:MAG: ribosome-associated translation inhibitor RaiA [Planctomycetes bacterium]|nr:ribosome-associated translation inhibitor RaiA [Planctomycetota bacterium]